MAIDATFRRWRLAFARLPQRDMSHQRRRPFFVPSWKTRLHAAPAQRRMRASSPSTSASAADSTTGIMSPANASPPGDEAAREAAVGARFDAPRARAAAEHAVDLGERIVPIAGCSAPRSASARSAARTRRASVSAALAPAGCSRARRCIPAARSASSTLAASSHRTSASKSRRPSTRSPRCVSSVLMKSSQSRSPKKRKGAPPFGARGRHGASVSLAGDAGKRARWPAAAPSEGLTMPSRGPTARTSAPRPARCARPGRAAPNSGPSGAASWPRSRRAGARRDSVRGCRRR